MMRLKLYLKSLAKRGPLLNLLLILLFFIPACQPRTKPDGFQKEDIPQAISDTSKKEHNLEVSSKLVGQTLWVYLPLENLFEKAKTPKKRTVRFSADKNSCQFENNFFNLDFLIKAVPETEQLQEYEPNKKVMENLNNVWTVIRRMLFSMDRSKAKEPNFIFLTASDIKNGIEIRQLSYYLDLKKLSYGFISVEEYQHRVIQETDFLPEIIGDKEGRHLKYYDVPLTEFIAKQIKSRVDAKFLGPEVQQNADIEKEIIKACSLTIRIYDFKGLDGVVINNLATNNRTLLNQRAIREKTAE